MPSILKELWERSEESRANCGFETQSLCPQIDFSIGTGDQILHQVMEDIGDDVQRDQPDEQAADSVEVDAGARCAGGLCHVALEDQEYHVS